MPAQVRDEIAGDSARRKETAPALTITFLGTGSGTPTLQRNLACVAVQRGGELLLFDCGEAAQIQYRRAGLGFAPLRAVFISHLHGDHVTGLPGLLMSLHMAGREAPLLLAGPPGLDGYLRCNQRALRTRFAYPVEVLEQPGEGNLLQGEGYSVTAAPLDHGVPCLGFRLEESSRSGRFSVQAARALGVPAGPLFGRLQRGEPVVLPDGSTIVPDQVLGPARPGAVLAYCTDTRPCSAAVDLAAGADLFIHEATFDATMAHEARRKYHSTAADAARLAARAGARELLLTHVSPRYQDPTLLRDQARAIFPATRVAHDLLRVEVFHREQ